MYCVMIPVALRTAFEQRAAKENLLLALDPETMHKLHFKQPIEKLGYEFFTEEEFEKARKISSFLRVANFFEPVLKRMS